MSDAVRLPRLPSLPSVTQKSFLEADSPPAVRGPGLRGGRQGAGVEKATPCHGASDAPCARTLPACSRPDGPRVRAAWNPSAHADVTIYD